MQVPLRFDSPFVLALVGTVSVHVLLLTATDVASTLTRRAPEPAPQLEMFDVEPVDPPQPPPQPRPAKTSEPTRVDPLAPPLAAQPHIRSSHPASEAPRHSPPSDLPPAPGPTGGDGGRTDDGWDPNGDLGGTGRRDAHGARGNAGHASGSGSGAGGSDGGAGPPAPPEPPSIATIKKRALPKGDYGLVEAGRDYPQEAKQLGIEGPIRVRLVVDAGGHVTSTTLLNHLGHGLDELALREAAKIEFEPAIDTDDHPTASIVVWTFHFTLPKM